MPTLEAQIVGVTEKAYGWTRIETDGRPQFLDTKREDLIEEARDVMREGALVVIKYSERDSRNVNPNTGKPYVDRYYEGIAGSANGDSRREPEPRRREPERREPEQPREPGYGYRTWPDDAWRMALTSGSERAVQTLPLMPTDQRDFGTQKAIALAWAEFIVSTPRERPAQPAPRRGAYDEPVYDEEQPPPHGDDDIPF